MVLRAWALLHGLWMTVFGMLRHGRTTVQNSSDLSITFLDQIFSGWKWGDFRGSFEFSRWSLKGWYHQFCGSARDWRSTFCRSTMMPLKPTRWGASAPRGGWGGSQGASGWRWSRFVSYHATWSRLDKMMGFLSRNYGMALSHDVSWFLPPFGDSIRGRPEVSSWRCHLERRLEKGATPGRGMARGILRFGERSEFRKVCRSCYWWFQNVSVCYDL